MMNNYDRPWQSEPMPERWRPARMQHPGVVAEQVWVPFLQAALWALAAGLVALAIMGLLALELPWPDMTPLLFGVLAGMAGAFYIHRRQEKPSLFMSSIFGLTTCIVTCFVASLTLALTPLPLELAGGTTLATVAVVLAMDLRAAFQQRRELLWEREERDQVDYNSDGHIGRPKREQHLVVEVHNEPNSGLPPIQYVQCGIPRERMMELARLWANGTTLSHTNVTGKDKPLSRDELTALQEELVELGHARRRSDKGENQGIELTPPGRAMFRVLAQGDDKDT